MKRTILVRGARQLLTLRGPTGARRGEALHDLGVIEDGSLLIVNGIIDSVGPTRRIENLSEARSAEEINAAGHVVMPGFVDSHTHLIAPPARFLNYRAGLEQLRGHGLTASSEEVASALHYMRNTPAGTLEFQAKRLIEAALRHGTTTLEAKTGGALNSAGEMKMLRVLASLARSCISIVPTFHGANAIPPDFEGGSDAYIRWLCADQIPRIAERKLAQFVDIRIDPGAFTVEQAGEYLSCARRHGLRAKVHTEQTTRTGSVGAAVDMDLASVDGLNHADQSDADLLGRSRTIATLLPGTVYQGQYSQYPPARDLIDAGAAVALATAFRPTIASTFNMQMVMSLACTHMGMTPEEAISAATINGAHALSRANRCGSLEFGKDADLIVLNVPDYREIPYHFGCNIVAMAMRRGEVVYREGTVTCSGQ